MFIATVDQHRKLHASRPAKIDQLIQRRPYRAAGVKHVIDQNDTASFNVTGQFGPADNRLGADGRKIVAIQSDIENPYRGTLAFEIGNFVGDAVGQRDAATADANQDQISQAVVFLYDLGSQPGQCAIDSRPIHDPSFFSEFHRREILTRTVKSDKGTSDKLNSCSGSSLNHLSLYRSFVRPILFRLPPESVHEFALHSLSVSLSSETARGFARRRFNSELFGKLIRFGLEFRNPVGLAAGFDKNGMAAQALAALGFGFIEVGSVTSHEQPGNPRPRLFRLPRDRALINRAGFNNCGAAQLAENIRRRRPDCVLGVNIGKSRSTAIENAIPDYLASFEAIYDIADYIAINVSSPNTPNLRELQRPEMLTELLRNLQQRNEELARRSSLPQPKPLLVKVAPDLTETEIESIVEIATRLKIAGLIATNTTVSREGLQTTHAEVEACGEGGLSGAPLRKRSDEVIALIYRLTRGEMPIIGVGGVFNAEDVWEKICAGASLIQLYTGFIYEGPGVARRINEGLGVILQREGFRSLDEAIGCRSGLNRLLKN